MMQIWVDADACPDVIKDILFRVAQRRALLVTLVAKQLLRAPGSRFIAALLLEKQGFALNPRGAFYTKDNIA